MKGKSVIFLLLVLVVLVTACGHPDIPVDADNRQLFSFDLGHDYYMPGEGDTWENVSFRILENSDWADNLQELNHDLDLKPGMPIELPLMFDIEARALVFNKLGDDNILLVRKSGNGFTNGAGRPIFYLYILNQNSEYQSTERFSRGGWIDAPFLNADEPIFLVKTLESKPRLCLFTYRKQLSEESNDEYALYRAVHLKIVQTNCP